MIPPKIANLHRMPKQLKEVYIALGSNLDEPEENLRRAAVRLSDLSEGKFSASSVWVSKPEGFVEEVPDFCNAVVRLRVSISATELLRKLQAIEQDFGRTRSPGSDYEPRRLDLDIIDYDGDCIDELGLTVPHPRAHERQFVLVPMQEICATFRFPDRQESLEELIASAPTNPMQKSIRLIPSA